MSDFRLSFPARVIAGKSRLSAEDLTIPRGTNSPDEVPMSKEAVTPLPFQDFHTDNSDEWNAFFLEAISEFIVHDTRSGGPEDGGDRRLVVPAADFAMLRAISDAIDPPLIDSEWKDFLARAEPRANPPKTRRWLRVSDDLFTLDEAAA
jgi:hypothetical protein